MIRSPCPNDIIFIEHSFGFTVELISCHAVFCFFRRSFLHTEHQLCPVQIMPELSGIDETSKPIIQSLATVHELLI